ncbi:MAG: PAS domain-containing protein [Proteobacteria bacterium]|nr:PAS domain-containing protein [Pseudomonadota bacterium]
MDVIGAGILALSIVLQLAAAWLALALIRETGWRTPWLLIGIALGLMATRRSITLLNYLFDDLRSPLNITAEIVALAISTLMVVGVALIRPALRKSKTTEAALVESEARYERAVMGTHDGLWDWDIPGNEMYFSPRYAEILGYRQDELEPVVATATDRIHPEDADRAAEILKAHLEHDAPYELEIRMRHRNGDYIWIRTKATVFRDDSGIPVHMAGSITDITEQRNRDEQLYQAQKMETTGQLTGGIAHDFNNLLAVVLGNLELVRDRLSEDDPVLPQLHRASQAAERGANLTRHLLAFSRQQVLAPTVIDLDKIVAGTIELIKHTLGEHILISSAAGNDMWHCWADPSQIENALLNLALNARDAMPDGGRLTIETSNISLDDEYAAAQAEVTPGEYVMLAVTDTGVGIPPDQLAHIFEPFFTTKEVGAGSGLGLSMIYGFVKQSGGHVTVYSEVGIGTTFKIYLPRALDGLQKQQPQDILPHQFETREATVFVVEDDPDVRTLAVALLSNLGYQVMEAGSGPAALELLGEDTHVDLLMTDVVLPRGMTGPALATVVREKIPGIKVLFMSGYTEQAMESPDRLGKTEHFLQKPFRKKDLADKLREILDSPN